MDRRSLANRINPAVLPGVLPHILAIVLTVPSFASTTPARQFQLVPWAPQFACNLNPARSQGLHPVAVAALQKIAVGHRITQGINNVSGRRNVHQTDGTLNGRSYTGAVDISVRCLTESQIKMLLARLAELGFAGWYRKDGRDGWSGPPHIHAVWAGCKLKPALQRQVQSWIDGGNGLGGDLPYQFWQATTGMKDKVRTLYRMFN
jgi:hypothetical protein